MKSKFTLIALLIVATVSFTAYARSTAKASCCPSSVCCDVGGTCCR
jgi:hypothetical protein